MTTTTRTERTIPVTTAPAATPTRTITTEDATKARKAIVALESVEQLVTRVLVVLGIGGLIFTAVNVTLFAVTHHVHWTIAWMLDPLVSVSLLAALFIDGKLAAYGHRPGGWPFVLRWFAGLSTWLMNCWGSLYPDARFTGWPDNPDPAGLLLHSVIPFLVIILAEAGAGYRKFSTRAKAEHQAILVAWKDQEEARRRAATEAVRRREEEALAEKRAAEKRAADLAAEEKRAALEAQKARDLAEAKARELAAIEEAEARRAERARAEAEARSKEEAESEARRKSAAENQARLDAEARLLQARIDRENAEHAAALEQKRRDAEAQAAADKERAETEARAAELEREEKKRAAEARRARTAETAAIPAAATAIPGRAVTALSPGRTATLAATATAKADRLTAILPTGRTAETDDVRGAEAKRRQIETATFEAAVLLALGEAPTRKDFATVYGRGETWGRDRYADAERMVEEDAEFAARVRAEVERRRPAVHARGA
ncbi:hypothetical protein ACVW0K_007408 [Streptomyces filamentosus]